MSNVRANTVLTHVTHVIIISVPSDFTDKKKGENYMKRILALLLTLAMLLTMVGTAAVAADAATAEIPEFTATLAKDGTVTVQVDDGVKDYTTHYAYVIVKKTEEGETRYHSYTVNLEYDSSKKAYIGKNEDAAGGQFDSIRLSKSEYKTNTKGDAATYDSVSFVAEYSWGSEKSGLWYATYSTTSRKEELVDRGDYKSWITTEEDTEYNRKDFNTATGKLSKETNSTTQVEGDEAKKTTNAINVTKTYEPREGKYSGKTVSESDSTSVYNKELEYWVNDASKSTSESYNEEDILIGSSVKEGKTTYNKKADERTSETDSKQKEFSSKGYLRYTTKGTQTREEELVDDYGWKSNKYHYETKTTNRDGEVSRTYENTTKYGKADTVEYGNYTSTYIPYTSESTDKDYNTYTGAVTKINEVEKEYAKNKKTDLYETTKTTTNTYNNDDGTLRRKTITETLDGVTIEETHYNSDNKVAAKYTFDEKKAVGTWVDGNGKVIGKNEVDDETGEYTEISDLSFKIRTGELDYWRTEEATVDKDDTWTYTTTYYNEGKKDYSTERIEKKDGSWKYYSKGVLRQSYDPEKSEYKYYDIKGTLSSSNKWDDEENARLYYNHNNKLIQKSGHDDDGKSVNTYYDPATGKVESSTKAYWDDEGAWVTEYHDAKDKLLYSEKSSYDEKVGAETTAYYDAKGKEFARTIDNHWEDDVWTGQHLYSGHKERDLAAGNTEVEKFKQENDYDYRKNTVTTDYTKWTVTNGKESDKRTRTDKTVTTWDNSKTETNSYIDGTLDSNTVIERNDYYLAKENSDPTSWEDAAKVTTKNYDWYTGKMTSMQKWIYSDVEDDPVSYYKYYDKYGNLQTYTETDNTDEWNWSHTYYADGTLKRESWEDYLDHDSSYSSSYYLDGTKAKENTSSGQGDETNGRYVVYNRDGSYRQWTDTTGGVSNTWVYNSNGALQGYIWNETNEDDVYSYEQWDAAGNLTYKYSGAWLAGGYTQTMTDPAGNKWERNDDGVTLTLANKGNGWQNAVGEWFYLEKGEPVTEAWKQIDGSWYYFDENGMMSKGLIPIQDEDDDEVYTTYAANDDGTVTSGWVSWTSNGDTAWAYTDANGEVKTGWQNLGGQWYYFTDGHRYHKTDYKEDAYWTQDGIRGQMATGAVKIWNSDWSDKHTYFFNDDGTWDNSPGWKVAGNDASSDIEYHYYNANGVEVTGWAVIDGNWYYFNEDGVMKNGWVKSGPNWYFMDPAKGGAMATDGWTEDVYEGWYYVDKNGNYKTGWLQDGNNWYYLKDDGSMAAKEWAKSGSDWYYMDENGAMATGWIQDHGSWYCLKSDGTMKTGWEGSGNTWYYLNADGTMAADTDVTIDGKTYHFDETGLCTNP